MSPDLNKPCLVIRDLCFSYPGKGFSLELNELEIGSGEGVSLAGESGSGKTTLLQLASGVLQATVGSIHACGKDLGTMGESGRRAFRISNIGLVFQEFELLEYLSVLENVLLPYRIHPALKLDREVRERAAALLEEMGLGDLQTRRPRQLSHGQRQRVAVCRALITRPQLVLADEPTANLDRENKRRVLDAFERHVAGSGASLLVATHDEETMERVDRGIDLEDLRKGGGDVG